MKISFQLECWRRSLPWLGLALAGLFLAGCKGVPTKSERQSRADLKAVTQVYRPGDRKATLPTLDTNATLGAFLTYAMLNQPRVEAAYYDYASAVERITLERSLPDPRLTLELDIQEVVTTVVPGLMTDLPWVKKLRIRADVASAESQAKYYGFETAVLQTAFDVKRTYYILHFLDERIRINRETLGLLAELEKSARAQNEVGKVTLQDVYRAQIEQDQLTTEVANLEDSRNPLLAQFKGALGLTRDQADPPVPAGFETTPLDLNADDLLATAFARNPRLKAMEADVRMAETGIRLARTSKLPDFNVGIEADAKASPVMTRPTLGVTLPIWRDKIAAQIAGAQANKRAAEARLTSEQVMLTVDFAMKAYDYREATRTLALLQNQLIPKARKSLEIARSGYLSGQIEFFNLIDAERTLLNFQLSEVEARTRREIVLAELSLMIAGVPPTGAPALASPPDLSSPAPKRSDQHQP